MKVQNWDLDFSFFEKGGRKEFADKLKGNKAKATKVVKIFFDDLNNEAKETHQASKLVVKYMKNGKLTKSEEKEIRLQVYDLLKMMGIGVPFVMIPGASFRGDGMERTETRRSPPKVTMDCKM